MNESKACADGNISPKKEGHRFLGCLIVVLLLLPLNCHAYIDPNTGGWLFQLLFPLLVAIGGAWVVLRQRIRAFWDRLFRRPKNRE